MRGTAARHVPLKAPPLRFRGGGMPNAAALRESGVLVAAGIPAATSAFLILVLLVFLPRRSLPSVAGHTGRGGGLTKVLVASASALVLFFVLTLRGEQPVASLTALCLLVGALVSGGAAGRDASPPGSVTSLRRAASSTASLALLFALLLPTLTSLLPRSVTVLPPKLS